MKMIRADFRPLILVVDDIADGMQMIGNVIRRNFDCDLAFASGGVEALNTIEKMLEKEIVPDLILLDVIMPGCDGFEVCRRLKNDERISDVPVIFLTAKGEPEDLLTGFEAGAIDYVPKPFVPAELVARVRTQLCIWRQTSFRKEMLHVLCHDLLNPFGAIISSIDIIDDFSMYLKFRDSLRELAQGGIDIIALAREMRMLEDRGIAPEDAPVSLRSLFDRACALCLDQFEAKGVKLINTVENGLMVKVVRSSFADLVLGNLLTNAMKFSMPGQSVVISARRERGMIQIDCRDEGIGMPESLCRDIFDIRRPTFRPGTAGETGNGLGLPLSAKIVDRLGGRCYVWSEVGKGTLMRVEMPDYTDGRPPVCSEDGMIAKLKGVRSSLQDGREREFATHLNREYFKISAELQQVFRLNRFEELALELGGEALRVSCGELAGHAVKMLQALEEVNFGQCIDLLEDFPALIDQIHG